MKNLSLSSIGITIITILIGIFSVLLVLNQQQQEDQPPSNLITSLQQHLNTATTSLSAILIPIYGYLSSATPKNLTSTTTTTTPSEQPPDSTKMSTPAKSIPRAIQKIFLAVEQAEGAGARVRRSIGTPQLRNFSPFLMLDHFSIRPGAGFPDHPHRGQETITYLLSGGVDHEDFAGNKGTINAGDLQFMTAGKGIMHAEMPRMNPDGSANVGLQLWVDLPKSLKKSEPRYRDLRAAEIPQVEVDDGKVKVKVISGQSHGVDSVKDLAYTPVWILDIEIQPGGKITQQVPEGWNAFAYLLEGADVVFGEGQTKKVAGQYHNVVFEREGGGNVVVASVDEGAEKSGRFVLIAGTPLDQKVVQYGPFVLNSQEEVYQAFEDFQGFKNGFERAKGWESEIGKRMVR
ncbi:RmlC-like cupin domain containing protein [Naviculisporaceae sp. PSN 640]